MKTLAFGGREVGRWTGHIVGGGGYIGGSGEGGREIVADGRFCRVFLVGCQCVARGRDTYTDPLRVYVRLLRLVVGIRDIREGRDGQLIATRVDVELGGGETGRLLLHEGGQWRGLAGRAGLGGLCVRAPRLCGAERFARLFGLALELPVLLVGGCGEGLCGEGGGLALFWLRGGRTLAGDGVEVLLFDGGEGG